jgi:hypothetical protein
MPEDNLSEVLKAAEQLLPKDRFQLFEYLAGLPDSGIKTIPAAQLQKSQQERKAVNGRGRPQELNFNYSCQIQDDQIIYCLEGAEIFRVVFNSENCTNVFFEKLKYDDSFLNLSSEQRARIDEAIREVLAAEGHNATDEQIKQLEEEAVKTLELQLLKESVEHATKRISSNLPQVVVMIWERILHAMTFSGANALRDIVQIPEQKFGAEEIRKAIFQPDWERLKLISGITRGGRRERKGFVWTPEKKVAFYKEIEALPKHKGKSVWKFALEELIEQEFDSDTIAWLKSRSYLQPLPEKLLDEAIKAWRKYLPNESWNELRSDDKPRAFELRHAIHLLGYPDEFMHSTLETYYYEGKKLSDGQT